jgi:hypothetical protein
MSTTIPIPPATTTAAIATSTTPTGLVSNLKTAALNGADDVPAIARAVGALDPDIATFLAGQSALGSKTLWAPIVTHAVVWGVAYLGLSWDPATTESVAGLISIGLMALFRVIAGGPITSVLPAAKPVA